MKPMNLPVRSVASLSRLLRLLCAAAFVLAAAPGRADEAAAYKDAHAPLEKRVDDLLGRMTPEEKLTMLSGTGFTTQPIPRLGLPAMRMADAGEGVRGGGPENSGPATAFPCGTAMSSSWDADLVGRVAKAIGEEARNKGAGSQVLLGPAVNIQRSPLGGRNGEYFSEDPFLAGRLTVAYVQGMQSSGDAACIKHYACNNQETERRSINALVGERALREIYLPAFEAGVKEGGAWTLMSSYNMVNGHHASANAYLLQDVLKKGWGFDGLVMSDWHGVHETGVMQEGNDLEMPRGTFNSADKLQAALQDGRLTPAAVDDSVRRILRTVVRVGLLDNPPKPDPAVVNSPEHQALAREAATKGLVLLQNDGGILPLDRAKVHSIAVVGHAADVIPASLGSPQVVPFYTVQFLDGITKQAGSAIAVRYAPANDTVPVPAEAVTTPDGAGHGFQAQYFHGTELAGTPFLERVDPGILFQFDADPGLWPGVPATDFSVRWTGDLKAPATGAFRFTFTGDDGFRIKVNGKTCVDHWAKGKASTTEFPLDLVAGQTYRVEVEYFQSTGSAAARLDWLLPAESAFAKAVAAAKESDVAVVCVSTLHDEGEGRDRPSMELPSKQAELIQAVAAVNKNVVVVLNNGTPVAMKEWLKKAPGVVEAWYPGEEGGAALAAVLFGDANPSGKLPLTLGADRADYPDAGNFPGAKGSVTYAEGIYVGYRHFDKKAIAPLFPFGYGLSYTTFRYDNPKLEPTPDGKWLASVDVTNTGTRAGEEVAELYVHDPAPKIDKPVRELKGFAKLALAPGETKTASFPLAPRDLAYFDVPGKQWKADAGSYDVEFGASSRDLRGKTPLVLKETFTEAVPLSQDFLN